MIQALKPLKFIGTSRTDLCGFPDAVRHAIGVELMVLQLGGVPSDFKSLPIVGAGAYEVRVSIKGEWRAIYVAKFLEAIYVLHTFPKKTQKTSKADLDIATARYKRIGVTL